MDEKLEARNNRGRELIGTFERQFSQLHLRLRSLINMTPEELIYRSARRSVEFPGNSINYSIGENILRGAAAVERTFGGITANLWDDPFEWALPETLSTAKLLLR